MSDESETNNQDTNTVKRATSALQPFKDGFYIDPTKPIEKYNVGTARAYKTIRRPDKTDMEYFTLICDRTILPRISEINSFTGFMSYNMATILSHGVVEWPPAKGERYAIVYRDNLGEPLLKQGRDLGGYKPDIIIEKFLKPVIETLNELRERDLYHGAIRPWNVWTMYKDTLEHVIIGDAVCEPPSYSQPVIYEPIHRAMAEPVARGLGSSKDDMYALGVTLAELLRTVPHEEGLTEEDIIRRKLEYGSYSTITGKDRYTGSVLELLRGLLHDEEKERWDVSDVKAWLGGRRLTPKASIKRLKATRPLIFGENKYVQLELLAMDLEKDPVETKRIIHEKELIKWIERSLTDNSAVDLIKMAQESAEKLGPANLYDARLISMITMALHPKAPLHYDKRHISISGFPSAFFNAMVIGKDVGDFAEILTQQLMPHWLREFGVNEKNFSIWIAKFENAAKSIQNSRMGSGIERALYTICTDAPCLSPKLANCFVLDSQQFLLACEKLCERKANPDKFMDRHIVAFLFSREPKLMEDPLRDIEASEDYRQIVLEMRVFSALQKKYNIEALPSLATFFEAKMPIIFARYHDKKYREKLQKDMSRLVNRGDLVGMLQLVDDYTVREADLKAFRQAIKDYKAYRNELRDLDLRLEDKENFGKKTGRDIGAAIACILCFFTLIVMFIINFTGNIVH